MSASPQTQSKNYYGSRPVPTTTKPGGVRNVTIKQSAAHNLAYKPTIDEQFNQEYSKKGLQPSSLDDKVEAQAKTTTQPKKYHRPTAFTKTVTERAEKQKLTLKKHKKNLAKAITAGIRSFGIFVWLAFQVPIAIFYLVSFGFGSLLSSGGGDGNVSAAVEALNGPVDSLLDDGVDLIGTLTGTKQLASSLAEGLTEVVISSIGSLFWIALVIMFTYAIMNILGIYITYKVAGIHPITGRKSVLKMGCVFLILLGSFIPVINFFPLFYPWTKVVQKYPA